MTKITIDKALIEQVLTLFDKALDTDNVFGRLHNDAMDCICELRAALAEPAVEPVAQTDEALREVFAQCLTSTYMCGRAWSAWGAGTMSEDDFSPASECDELLDELVNTHKTINAPLVAPVREPVTLLTDDEKYVMIDHVIHKRWSLLDLVNNTETTVHQKTGLK